MKIIDCFTFFNELDLLEFRLRLLDKYVDHFIIAESNLTHSGSRKPYFFEENKSRYAAWLGKIIYIPLEQSTGGLDFTKKETSYNPESAAWKLENEQRNALSAATAVLDDEDLVLLSDLDEIPDPSSLKKIDLQNGPAALSMLFHYYFFNCQHVGADRWWNGTVICTGRQFRQTTPQKLRDNRNVYKSIPRSGWHFSFLGGFEKIKYKIRSFAHTEFNREETLTDENIIRAMEEGKDIFNRPGTAFKFVPLHYYPPFLCNEMIKYPSFLHLKKKEGFFTRLYYSLKHSFSS